MVALSSRFNAEFVMHKSTYYDVSDIYLEHATTPHLTGVEGNALNLLAISKEAFVTSLMISSTCDRQRLAIHMFMARELAESNRRGLIPSRPSQSDAVMIRTSSYLRESLNRLSMNRYLREVGISIASRSLEAPQAKVNVLHS